MSEQEIKKQAEHFNMAAWEAYCDNLKKQNTAMRELLAMSLWVLTLDEQQKDEHYNRELNSLCNDIRSLLKGVEE